MPLAEGVSGSTAELINVAMTMGLAANNLQKSAVAAIAYISGGGNHSFHEIAIVLRVAGLDINPDSYTGVEKLIGTTLFTKLKDAHPDAFKDTPAPGAPPAVT